MSRTSCPHCGFSAGATYGSHSTQQLFCDATISAGERWKLGFGGGYTEAVIGYAYRPVNHERFKALAKYTYFYTVPTTAQVTG